MAIAHQPGEPLRVGAVDLRDMLSAHVDALADAVLERFAAGAGPDGAPDAATLRNLRLGARGAVDCFLARLAGERRVADDALFVAHGRAQQAAGRTLTELLSFYRLGGLAMWERSTALLPQATSLPAAEIFAFGSAVLELVDELSVAAAEGFTAQEAEARRREPRAARAARVAAAQRPAGAPTTSSRAAAARGGLAAARCGCASPSPRCRPTRSAVPAGAGARPRADRARRRRAHRARRRRRRRGRALAGARRDRAGARGAAGDRPDRRRPPRRARSAARAVALLDHVTAGALGGRDGAGVVRCDDHEIALLLGAAPELAHEVAGRRLAPLARSSPPRASA